MSTQVIEQLLKDQQLLAKQLELTGHAVAKLSLPQKEGKQKEPQSPTSSESSGDNRVHHFSSRGTTHQRHTAEQNRRDEGDRFHARNFVPKMAFPKFEGDNPRIWKDKCLAYFKLFDLPPNLWATMASLNMDGIAAKWLQVYKQKQVVADWESFIQAVESKFGDNDYREALTQLLELQQTDSLETYMASFEELQYQLSMHNNGLDELFFVTQFIKGLKAEVSSVVQSQVPDTLQRAMLLAKIQQQMLDRAKAKWQKNADSPKYQSTYHKTEAKGQSPSNQLWKERQVRDYRKANGLCFYCGETFDAQHKNNCKKRPQLQPQLNALVLNDLDVVLTDEVLNQLAVEDALAEDFCQLSLNALAGTEKGEAMKFRALVKNKVMLVLVDSGSTHSFISQNFLSTVGLSTQSIPAKQVRLANGDILISDQWVPHMDCWTNGHILHSDMRVLNLGVYDAILGYDWLKAHSPMVCNWEAKRLEFSEGGSSVLLKGIQSGVQEVQAVSIDKVHKWACGNDIWAVAVVESLQQQHKQPELSEIQKLLKDFEDVFQQPVELPPARFYDHQIPLLPGSAPVNSKPYRYCPQHKDEIEKQVKELLTAGLITHSSSPFVSPVLLVLKKDGSWRFCVDYRKLNAITVKNRFPMPLMEEILDELAGTQYFTKLDMRSGYHQVRMKEEDEHKTAFKTHHGHYQFKVMPFGLTNAPATFQCIMNEVLAPFLRKFVMVFLDDILVYSPTLESHLERLTLVLQKLREHKLYMKTSKCSFAQKSLEYLGHIISVEGVATDPSKTEAMLNWPVPRNVTELRGFLGLNGYYRKFVKNYGWLAKPLTHLLKKKQFSWSDEAQRAFEHLKTAMSSTPVLALPNFQDTFIIETDACDVGIGAVLMQRDQPVAFLSKALSSQHLHLSIYEKKKFGLDHGCREMETVFARQGVYYQD